MPDPQGKGKGRLRTVLHGCGGAHVIIKQGKRDMPAINTAEDAVNVAERLLERYYAFRKLLNARRQDGMWLVEFDVGIISKQLARITLDAATGDIMEYITPG